METIENSSNSISPYSSSMIRAKSKKRLIKSATHRSNIRHIRSRKRPQTTKVNRNSMNNLHSHKGGYSDWGMKINSTEALQEQILTLKKDLRRVNDENVMIKTDKRRMETLLKKNDRKFQTLLNTVSSDNKKQNNTKNDNNRKFSSTELLDILNVTNNSNLILKRQLLKTNQELQTSQSIINHLEKNKNTYNHNNEFEYNPKEIDQLNDQIDNYKSELIECHDILETLTKSNEESLNIISEKDDEINKLQNNFNEYKDTKDTNDSLRNKIKLLEHENNTLQHQKQILQDQNNELQDQNNEFQNKNDVFQDKNNELQGKNNELQDHQKDIESIHQSQIIKLNDKLGGIEVGLKEQIVFYQNFEKQCASNSKFVSNLVESANKNEDEKITLICQNIKNSFEQLQNPQTDINNLIVNSIHYFEQLFMNENKDIIRQQIENEETRKAKIQHNDAFDALENSIEDKDVESISLYDAVKEIQDIQSRES